MRKVHMCFTIPDEGELQAVTFAEDMIAVYNGTAEAEQVSFVLETIQDVEFEYTDI